MSRFTRLLPAEYSSSVRARPKSDGFLDLTTLTGAPRGGFASAFNHNLTGYAGYAARVYYFPSCCYCC